MGERSEKNTQGKHYGRGLFIGSLKNQGKDQPPTPEDGAEEYAERATGVLRRRCTLGERRGLRKSRGPNSVNERETFST